MPWKPKKPCRAPGCRSLAERGSYCEAHRLDAQKEYNRYRRDKDAQAFYDSPAWRAKRKEYRAAHPLCEACLRQGVRRVAHLVDHITPIKCGGAPLDDDNLQSLCRVCHEIKSIAEGSRFPSGGGGD